MKSEKLPKTSIKFNLFPDIPQIALTAKKVKLNLLYLILMYSIYKLLHKKT